MTIFPSPVTPGSTRGGARSGSDRGSGIPDQVGRDEQERFSRKVKRRERLRIGLRWLLVAAFGFAGWKHVTDPGVFLPIVPGWVPAPRMTVILTGWCELAGAVGLLTPRLRRPAGLMLAIYTACVFPANIDHALRHPAYGVGALGWWYHAPRLAFQPVIAWWCLFAGGVTGWPFRAPARTAARPAVPPPRPRAPGPTG